MANQSEKRDEFGIIQEYFTKQPKRKDVITGIGDDCAVVAVPRDQQLALTIDTLVAGVHFPLETSAQDIGYKALAVNLSDLAAQGAVPAWATLALTMPEADSTWLTAFAKGFFALAKQFSVALIGGDTTRGPLTVSIQAHGFVPKGKVISRAGAKVGDLIYVTNTVGDAGLALDVVRNKVNVDGREKKIILERLNRPLPRVREGILLRDVVSAMIDVSDGLLADLSHILESSRVGARIDVEKIPLSAILSRAVWPNLAIEYALRSGDDYELCFTVAPRKKAQLEKMMKARKIKITCIGEIIAGKKVLLQREDGSLFQVEKSGYLHF